MGMVARRPPRPKTDPLLIETKAKKKKGRPVRRGKRPQKFSVIINRFINTILTHLFYIPNKLNLKNKKIYKFFSPELVNCEIVSMISH